MTKKCSLLASVFIFLLAVAGLLFFLTLNSGKNSAIVGSWKTRDAKQFGREGPLAVVYQFHDDGTLVTKRFFPDGEHSDNCKYELDGDTVTIISPVDHMYDLKFRYQLKASGLEMRCVSDHPEWKDHVIRFESRE